jgi:hypothetical protein
MVTKLWVTTMEVHQTPTDSTKNPLGLRDPGSPVQASFDGGAAKSLSKPKAGANQTGVFTIDIPDGTQGITVTIAQSGDFWDYSQALTFTAGSPPQIALSGTVNPGSFIGHFANPNTGDTGVELGIVMTQIRDGTSDYLAWSADPNNKNDPFYGGQWGNYALTPSFVDSRPHWFMNEPCLRTDADAANGNLFNCTQFSGDGSGTGFFLVRPTLPKLVAIWVPKGLTLPPAGSVGFHTFLHPDTLTDSFPTDQGTWAYPKRWPYSSLVSRYLYPDMCLVYAHQLAGATAAGKTVLVFPVGMGGMQWGNKFLTFDFQHRLLQEISFFLQRKDGAVAWKDLNWTVGPSALSGFSAGVRFVNAIFSSFVSGQGTQRAQSYYDTVLKEVYLFDGVVGKVGGSSGFQSKLLAWYRSGADNRVIRSYSQSSEWNALVNTVAAGGTRNTMLDGWEQHAPSGSVVYVPLDKIWKIHQNPPPPHDKLWTSGAPDPNRKTKDYPNGMPYSLEHYYWVHPHFPMHWVAHALKRSNLP